MAYYNLLHLKKEPFSNSPDPELFYNSYQHENCLQKLEIALRLRRGLSVIIGNIGTGKSTLSRQLLRMISRDNKNIISHLILDPEFTSSKEFLHTIIKTFGINKSADDSEWQMKEDIKTYLFKQGVDLQTVPTLIIDEGQKLPDFCIEILREFLNYETNQHKLLQIIIFAQEEFKETLKKKANFADRITTFQHLTPLNFKETRQMIQFRIKQTQEDPEQKLRLFSPAAFLGIYLLSGGYPRKIVMLCSKVIFNMLVKSKKKAGLLLVLASARETSFSVTGITKGVIGTLIVITVAIAFLFFKYGQSPSISNTSLKPAQTKSVSVPTVSRPANNKNNKSLEAIAAPLPHKATTRETKDETVRTAFRPVEHVIEAADQKRAISPNMGTLEVQKGDSLQQIIKRVYGSFNITIQEAVLSQNPHIKTPAKIITGTKITLPVFKLPAQLAEDKITTSENESPISETIEEKLSLKNSVPGRFPEASIRLMKESELFSISLSDLKIMRNEIYARHSYIFTSEEMKEYFGKQPWYKGTSRDIYAKLSVIEIKNLATIKNHERKRQDSNSTFRRDVKSPVPSKESAF